MQKGFFTIVFLFGLFSAYSQFNATTKSADIYFNAAYLNQSATVSLKPGFNTILIGNTSHSEGFQSFSIAQQDGFEYVSSKAKTDYSKRVKTSDAYNDLETRYKEAKQKLNLLNEKKRYFKEEETLILSQKDILGANSKLLLEDLMEMGDIYRNRLPYIANQIYILQDSIEYYTTEVRRWNESLKQLPNESEFKNYLEITLNCQRPGNYTLEFGYLVRSINWNPLYRIENQSGKDGVKVALNAKVNQNSGIDLDNCDLKFISSNYVSQQYLGELRTLYADYNQNQYLDGMKVRGARAEESNAKMETMAMADMETVSYDDVQSEGLRLFKSSGTVSITNGSNNYNVGLSTANVTCEKYYLARPELSPYAYLQADVEAYKQYFPINAYAELWLDNVLNGKTYINTSEGENLLHVNLGQDQQISVAKITIDDKSKDANIISSSKKVKNFKITINSGKPFPIDLKIEDNYPISKNESIKIELNGISGASNNTNKGILTWNFNLKGNESKDLTWGYTVKYDENKGFGIR